MVMAKNNIDYYHDTRQNKDKVAPLDVWDRFAEHLQRMQELQSGSYLEPFAESCQAIYKGLQTIDKEAQKQSIILARHERIEQLWEMYHHSNPIDFWLIKFPAWSISNFIHKIQERKQYHV